MATITTRSGKGSPLTNNEVDANFTNLNTDKVELDDISASTASASGTGSLTYSNSSGVFTYTPPVLLTASSTDTFTNKSGAISQWTNDTGYAVVSVANTFTAANTFTGGLKSEGAGTDSVRIGTDAGLTSQANTSIAIGKESGKSGQKTGALAIGNNAGFSNQGQKSFALGLQAGKTDQGNFSIAIGNSAGKTSQGDKGVIISANSVALEDTTDSHIHIASDEASINYTSAAGFSVTSTVTAANKFTASAYYLAGVGGAAGSVSGFYGFRLYSMNSDYIWNANTTPASTAMQLGATTGNLALLGTCTATSFIGSGAALTGLLNLADLKTLVAASADFADFQTRIAAL